MQVLMLALMLVLVLVLVLMLVLVPMQYLALPPVTEAIPTPQNTCP